MSRSYKKVWGFTDRNPWAKRQANKKVRKSHRISNGSGYKKVYCSYDICDFKSLLFPDCCSGNDYSWVEYYKDEIYKLYIK